MTLDQSVIIKNEKLVRYSINDWDLDTLKNVLLDKKFDCFFIVFEDSKSYIRYKLPNIYNDDDFYSLILSSVFEREENSIDSENMVLLEASFIDCYFKYPIK